MKFGDIVAWCLPPFDDGRYLYVTPVTPDMGAYGGYVTVVCLRPPVKSNWEVGMTSPVDEAMMRRVDERTGR